MTDDYYDGITPMDRRGKWELAAVAVIWLACVIVCAWAVAGALR